MLIGAGWSLEASPDEGVPEFMRGRWRVFAGGPSVEQPFSNIFLLHFANEEKCRYFRADPHPGLHEVYQLYSLEMLRGLLRCADPDVADEIDGFLWMNPL
jgi:hypothetical protein